MRRQGCHRLQRCSPLLPPPLCSVAISSTGSVGDRRRSVAHEQEKRRKACLPRWQSRSMGTTVDLIQQINARPHTAGRPSPCGGGDEHGILTHRNNSPARQDLGKASPAIATAEVQGRPAGRRVFGVSACRRRSAFFVPRLPAGAVRAGRERGGSGSFAPEGFILERWGRRGSRRCCCEKT